MSSVSAVPAVAAVDRVDLVRFARLLDGTGDAQLKRVFTAAELADRNGNLTLDPGFVDPAGGDWRLRQDSPGRLQGCEVLGALP